MRTSPTPRIRVVRVIARLNIGGPAIQAITLSRRLEEYGFITTLVRGQEAADEGSMDHLARDLGVQPLRVPSLRRDPGRQDMHALWSLVGILRRSRPQIVHTHAAKAGAIGRLATLLAFPRSSERPALIHTYHGHSLSGYFSPRVAETYRRIEQMLGRFTDRLIAVSAEVRDDLVRLGVAPPEKFTVIPLGFDLCPLGLDGPSRAKSRHRTRARLGLPAEARVITLVARLVPIKRVDRFLQMAHLLADRQDLHFLIVGDGELRAELESSTAGRTLGDRLVWAGFQQDMPGVYFASDVVVQTSDSEGTPVALIEAQAAGVPVVSTDVGGTPSVVDNAHTGFLVAGEDLDGLAAAVAKLCEDPTLAREFGLRGRERCLARFGLDRLVTDITELYRQSMPLLNATAGARR